jgi:transcription elongation GreA/GreB family factor
MDQLIHLFPKTIRALEARLAKLKDKFKLEDGQKPTGANSRYLDPERVSVFSDIGEIEKLLNIVRPLSIPESNLQAVKGHKVVLQGKDGEKLIFHLGTDLDVKNQAADSDLVGRLISVDSPLGEKLLNKKKGDSVEVGTKKLEIVGIEVSDYF